MTHPTTAVARPTRLPRAMAWSFLLGGLAILHGMYFTAEPAPRFAYTEIGRLLGLYLAFVLAVQLLLVSRLSVLDSAFGLDRLTGWHRWTGFAIFWLALLHPTFVLVGYARSGGVPFLRQVTTFARQLPLALGMIAVGLIVIAAVLSLRAARRRMPYEAWHTVHLVLYAVVVLAVIHQVYEGTAFTINLGTRIFWWGLWTFAIGALLIGRIVLPVVRNVRHRFRVAAVVPEAGNAVSVHVTGRDLHRLPAQAGQFFLWRFPGHNPWWQVNPFSLSAAPDGHSLRLTAKGIGTTSSGLRYLAIGTRVFAEGPYGALTAAQSVCDRTLLIAGGIGVTPIRALLEDPELDDIVILYRVREAAQAPLLDELRDLARSRDARLHLLTGRTGPDNDPFAPEHLADLVPDLTERDVFLCGPPGLTETVVDSLRRLDVPQRQIHTELFRLAGG